MNQKEEFLVQVAELYYQQDLNQQEIAKIFNISRPTVSRLLEEARKRKIVEIIIHSPIAKNYELSEAVREAYGLKNCIVIDSRAGYQETLKCCSTAAANFLHSVLESNLVLAVSWGSAITYLAQVLEPRAYNNVHVVQMVGCLAAGNPQQDGIEISMKIAQKLGAGYSNIFAPVFVNSELMAAHFLEEPRIVSTMEKINIADIAVMGIGSVADKNSILSTTESVLPHEWKVLKEKGAQGHLLARMFDAEGKEIPIPGKNAVSPPLDILKKIRWTIGIAVSARKASAVSAAVRAGYINSLIIDSGLAEALLKNN